MASDVYDKGAPLAEAVFLLNKKFFQNFLLSKKCSTRDAHSHERKNVAKATGARCVECRKGHSFY